MYIPTFNISKTVRISRHKIIGTCILNTDEHTHTQIRGQTDTQLHGHTDGQADSSIPHESIRLS